MYKADFPTWYRALTDFDALNVDEMRLIKQDIEDDMELYYTDPKGYWLPFDRREKRLDMLVKIKSILGNKE